MSLRLNRRTLLRGAGSVATALPWLEAMLPEPPVQAAPAAARRFVAVYTPGGTVLENRHRDQLRAQPDLGAARAALGRQPQAQACFVGGLTATRARGMVDARWAPGTTY